MDEHEFAFVWYNLLLETLSLDVLPKIVHELLAQEARAGHQNTFDLLEIMRENALRKLLRLKTSKLTCRRKATPIALKKLFKLLSCCWVSPFLLRAILGQKILNMLENWFLVQFEPACQFWI
jgi:hypothetical protein